MTNPIPEVTYQSRDLAKATFWREPFFRDRSYLDEMLKYIIESPVLYLRDCQLNKEISDTFGGYPTETEAFMYDIIHTDGAQHSILGISACKGRRALPEILASWAVLDEQGELITMKHRKYATLPPAFLSDENMYNELAGFTYSFSIMHEPIIKTEKKPIVLHIGANLFN